jgi:hypothetical protein
MNALFQSRTWPQVAMILIAIAGIAADRPQGALSIPAIFQEESFRPTLPTERALIKSYGKGVLERLRRQAYRIYKDPKSGLWISCRIDDDDRVNRPITAIVLSGVNLSNNPSVPDIALPPLQLHGLQIGNTVPDIVEKCGQPRRIYDRALTDKLSFRTYEYFLKDKDSCLRFYVENDRIVAASISSEE